MSRFPFRVLARLPRQPHVLAAGAFVVLLALELFGLHWLRTTEYRLSDVLMARQAAAYRADPDIVVIDVDDKSIAGMEGLAGLWPWPREIHADLLAALAEFQPRAIVFDITFSERDPRRPKSDAHLSAAIAAMPHVYLPAVLSEGRTDIAATGLSGLQRAFGMAQAGAPAARAALQLPQAVQPDAWRLGLINRNDDADGVLRRYRLFTDIEGWRLPSLPARVAADLGGRMPAGDAFMMRWPAEGYLRFSYHDVYRLLTEQRPGMSADTVAGLQKQFGGKIIVIGASAASSFDHHVTPIGSGYPGAYVLAIAIDNLKNGRSVRGAPNGIPFAYGAGLIALLALAFARRRHPLLTGGALAAVSAATLAAAGAALGRDLLLPVATPLIFAWAFYLVAAVGGYLRERRAREQAVSLFGRFLNPAVVRQIVDQGQTVESLSGRHCNLTVLFSDIRGFTTLSEARPPQEVVALLNRHFERQVEVVFRHGGTLDKFIGDCIMAFWGAPLDDPDHARNAVAAALEMQEALLAFKQELIDGGADVGDFDIGIGVHSGPAVVGFIGAKRKLDYTAIGDTVNLASRVEGLTKGISRILVTRDTMLACGASDRGANAFDFEERGAFAVKGRAAEVEVYEPRRRTP
ncbi:MAG TPA: adenylate/guanylate cyclase domain-containing protein [Paucimonas sp.]|nr:adenylate/guanylate cyclase domain-containing protein [Paucimonas sp.]